jgi:predicted dehydrogenase
MNRAYNRRDFLGQTGAGMVAAGYFVNPVKAQDSTSPNERLNIAAVGTSGRAGANIREVASQNVVAIADIDAQFLGQAGKRYPAARKYEDFRIMLEKEADRIDAVVVATPDHTHAPAAAMALRLKKHVYCEKPLTHTVHEARVLSELAAKNNLVTQMGTQIHAGDNYRRVVELVQGGAIGDIREVHVWAGAKYTGAKFNTGSPLPSHVNWDLWLGPAMKRPYSTGVHPFKWRSFWDYGTGALGDFGCHYMDLVHWALKLKHPTRISAEGPPVEDVSTPAWTIAHYEYPRRGKMPPVKLTWYDSGKRPALLARLKDSKGNPVTKGSGQLFVGKEGMILSDYSSHRLFPEEKFADFQPPKQTLAPSVGHHREWIDAIKTGGTTTCNFDYSGALTEAVLLGTVAYRSGETIDWDGKQFKANNAPAAQKLLHKEYRKGWTL